MGTPSARQAGPSTSQLARWAENSSVGPVAMCATMLDPCQLDARAGLARVPRDGVEMGIFGDDAPQHVPHAAADARALGRALLGKGSGEIAPGDPVERR